MTSETTTAPWLVTLDVDGTVLRSDETASPDVIEQVRRLSAVGHRVMLATGRSPATTVPVVEYLGITPEFLVCSNGAIVMRRDPGGGYQREWAECFDPTDALQTISAHLPKARFAVEDERGRYRYTEPFSDTTIGTGAKQVTFEELLHRQATRVVVVSPDHDMVDFLAVVERMGLHRVSYFIGWTAWLDIAAEGVNKGTAMERVRHKLGIPRERVLAVADGRNDIELLTWAAERGRGVAMGHSPADLLAVANEVTGTISEDGLAEALATL
ncbi:MULTISPECIES: HAD family hydrolase [unclassified Mycobacterium]|uniref:HAD family hydrolase n=1 Tax=unclassified Mycobacterium TaxID=2642494 RepID=UPI0029C79FA8|nr:MULTISPECIES: HAD family hydrolase [unclassified Mycobacterium]